MRYEIGLEGHLGDEWVDRFDALCIVHKDKDVTLLICSVVDQAALFGILRKVRDLGLPLCSVDRVQDSRIET